VPEELLRRAIAAGINKINFGTELKDAFTRAVKTTLADTDEIDLRKNFAPAIYAVQQMAAAKIKMCRASLAF
jgi:fructose/tagatose bisphosphate aldolase